MPPSCVKLTKWRRSRGVGPSLGERCARLRGAPSIVSALWMTNGSGGTMNVLVFESELAALAALQPVRNAPRPPFLRLEDAGVFRVLASL